MNEEYMEEYEEEYEEEYDDCLDGLLAFLASLPRESVKLLNVPKYKQMLIAASELKDLLRMYGESGEIEINLHREFNMGSITAEIPSFTVREPELFIRVVKEADNFEVYPLLNGNIKIGISFQSVLKTIG